MPLTQEVKDKIYNDFFLPYLGEKDTKTIQKELGKFCETVAMMMSEKKHGYKGVHPLAQTTLEAVYCFDDYRERQFPGISGAAIQTYIRELFFNIIHKNNEISLFIDKKNPTPSITFFDSVKGYPDNLYYVVGDRVNIFEQTYRRNAFNESEFLKSLLECKDLKLFNTCYQALEYAQGMTEGEIIGKEIREFLVPSIWAVIFKGNVTELKFKDEDHICHRGMLNDNYGTSQRLAQVSFASINPSDVHPLMGALVVDNHNFGTVLKLHSEESNDFTKLLEETLSKEAESKKGCSLQ